MRRFAFAVITISSLVVANGCKSHEANQSASRTRGRSHYTQPVRTSGNYNAYKPVFTAADNPTTNSGRGAPSLDSAERPAAWILVDGKQGEFVNRNGFPQLQWVIQQPVSATPTFRVEVFEPLVRQPSEFRYMIKSIEGNDDIAYAVSASGGSFVPGKQYFLLEPGSEFTIRNWSTGDTVRRISPLPQGTYLLAASIRSGNGQETAAVTQFHVGH